jgi:hypothetical protein
VCVPRIAHVHLEHMHYEHMCSCWEVLCAKHTPQPLLSQREGMAWHGKSSQVKERKGKAWHDMEMERKGKARKKKLRCANGVVKNEKW